MPNVLCYVDLVRQSFGVVQTKDGSVVEPSRLVVDTPFLSLDTTQGLLVGVGCRAQWVLRCAKSFRGEAYSKEMFIAKWLSICRSGNDRLRYRCRVKICGTLFQCWRAGFSPAPPSTVRYRGRLSHRPRNSNRERTRNNDL